MIKINIFTRELLPGMPWVSKEKKLSTKYDSYSFGVSLEVLTD